MALGNKQFFINWNCIVVVCW